MKLDRDLATMLHMLNDKDLERLARLQRKRDVDRGTKHEYLVTRLLSGLAFGKVASTAPYEWEESARIAEELGRQPLPGCAFVPIDHEILARRDLTSAVSSAGGFLVESSRPGDLFVAELRNLSVMDRLGVRRIPILGNSAVPRSTGSVTTSWLTTEATQATESTHSFVIAPGTPKRNAAYAEASRLILSQTSQAAQNFVLSIMARAVSEAVDGALISGTGASGQPLGILNTQGIGSQAGAALAWSGVLNMIETVETAKALVTPESGGWAVVPTVAEILRGRERATGSGFIMDGNAIASYRALSTGSVPSGTAIFGDWSQVAILEWGVLEIGADPYGANSALFNKGLVGLRAVWACDVLVMTPSSFIAATSVT